MKYPLFIHTLWIVPVGLVATLWGGRTSAKTSTGSEPAVVNIPAPELTAGQWLNTEGKPLSLKDRRGKVTVVHFWTLGNSSARANLPSYSKWAAQLSDRGVQVIGIHTPELPPGHAPASLTAQIKQLGIKYPVLLDSKAENWKRWQQRSRPTIYLIDRKGRIRYRWQGELEQKGAEGTRKMSQRIESLLNENDPNAKVEKTDEEWRSILNPEQFNVLRQHGTERPYSGEYWNNHETGEYLCAGCGQELFESNTKFESGTGWPSFWKPVKPDAVTEKRDVTYGMVRTEVLCSRCGGHLGHVFNDGPQPTGLRYCMNSAALRFEKK